MNKGVSLTLPGLVDQISAHKLKKGEPRLGLFRSLKLFGESLLSRVLTELEGQLRSFDPETNESSRPVLVEGREEEKHKLIGNDSN